ncbi:hypothetical protein MMC25_002013 [Agyrium rufum]|nr:hypothetical protein [Agyrium rufum]
MDSGDPVLPFNLGGQYLPLNSPFFSSLHTRCRVYTTDTIEANSDDWTAPSNRPALALRSWQKKLSTIEGLEYESNLDSPTVNGPRLVDDRVHRKNRSVWFKLFRYRYSKYGTDGLLPVWRGFIDRKVIIPPTNEKIWPLIFKLKTISPQQVAEIVEYAEQVFKATGQKPGALYSHIVGYHVQRSQHLAIQYHHRLRNQFPPDKWQFVELIQTSINNSEAQSLLRGFYRDFAFQDLYTRVMTILCRSQPFPSEEALFWHSLMINHGDKPSSLEVADQIDLYLLRARDQQKLSLVSNATENEPKSFEPQRVADLKPEESGSMENRTIDNSNEPSKARPIHREDKSQRKISEPQHLWRLIKQTNAKTLIKKYTGLDESTDMVDRQLSYLPTKLKPIGSLASDNNTVTVTQRVPSVEMVLDLSRETMKVESTSEEERNLSDSFCARLFATRFFSAATIIKGLEILGVTRVGPRSLREIGLRVSTDGNHCDVDALLKTIEQLKQAQIKIPQSDSRFTKLVLALAKKNDTAMLHSVLYCDLPFKVYSDRILLESLVSQYQKVHDVKQMERTLAILLFDAENEHVAIRERHNILLRAHARRRDWPSFRSYLNQMLIDKVVVSDLSVQTIRGRMLPYREVSKALYERRQGMGPEFALTRLLQTILFYGQSVETPHWRELLIRFGKSMRLREYDMLVTWLVRWDLNKSLREEQRRHAGVLANDSRDQAYTPGSGIDLKALINRDMVHAVVGWGFQASGVIDGVETFSKSQRHEQRLEWNEPAGAEWRWGLKLLAKLREMGADIPLSAIAQSCIIRMKIIFGPVPSIYHINVQARYRHKKGMPMTDYLAGMEDIVGCDLFDKYMAGHGWTTSVFQDLAREERLRLVEKQILSSSARRGYPVRHHQPRTSSVALQGP